MEIAKKIVNFAAERLRSDKIRCVMLALYLLFTVAASAVCFSQGRVRNGLLPLAYAALFLLATLLSEYFGKIRCGKIFLAILYFVPVGGILGTCFELYTLVPFFDTLLHIVSGFIFAALGYVVALRLCRGGSPAMCLLFALCFSLAVALLWELFEWGLTVLTSGDMLEDSIVRDIRSYFLSGSHNEAVELLGIEKTVIYHSGGEYVVDGYLDIGLTDTLTDMLVCLLGDLAFLAVALLERPLGRGLLRFVAPTVAED